MTHCKVSMLHFRLPIAWKLILQKITPGRSCSSRMQMEWLFKLVHMTSSRSRQTFFPLSISNIFALAAHLSPQKQDPEYVMSLKYCVELSLCDHTLQQRHDMETEAEASFRTVSISASLTRKSSIVFCMLSKLPLLLNATKCSKQSYKSGSKG